MSVFSSPIPIAAFGGSRNVKSSESESGDGDTDGQKEVRDLSESHRELKKRICYVAASTPVVLVCLYIIWLLYDAGWPSCSRTGAGGSKNGKSSESESGGGDTDGQTEVRDLSESRRELKKRTCYMAASMPVVLACLYITWLLYDAGIVYRELRIDVATARVTVETTCNSQALKSKYPEEVIATTISSNACQEARKLSDCDQVKEFDNRFRERRLDTGHWFSGSSIVLACVYWVVINIIYNPLGAVGGALLVYYLGRRYWNWAPGPCLRTLRETYRLQRETKNGLPFEAHRKSD